MQLGRVIFTMFNTLDCIITTRTTRTITTTSTTSIITTTSTIITNVMTELRLPL